MSTKAVPYIVHPSQGGLDTMTAPTLLAPGDLQTADNIEYFNPGSKRKRLGTAKHSSLLSQTNGSPAVLTALVDYWHSPDLQPAFPQFLFAAGSGGYALNAFAQPLLWAFLDSGPGLPFGSSAGRYNIVVAQGYAVVSHDLGTDLPRKYVPTPSDAFSTLSDCAPKFGFAVYHLRRLWAAGVTTAVAPATDNDEARSSVYFSAAGDITDWDGEDAAHLTFDEGDGDRVIGISKPFRGGIYIFKGPNVGSIHGITGRTIRQFARDRLMDTAPCVAHGSVVTTPNDIYWMSAYGIHSLIATQKYGNTEEAYVSHKIKNYFQNLEQTALDGVCSFYHPTRNLIGWFVPEAGSTQNTVGLIFNYVMGHWAIWRYSFNVSACAVIRDPTTALPRLFLCGYDGYIRTADGAALVDDGGTAYTSRIKFPNLIRLGDQMTELTEKSFQSVTTFFSPTATSANAQLNVTVDGRLTTHSVNLQGTGGAWGTGTFGSAVYGGNSGSFFTETPISDRGRAIQLEYVNSAAYVDMEIFGYAIRAVPAEAIAMEGS